MAAEIKYREFLKRMAVDFRAFKEYIEEKRSFRSFPWQKYKDQLDAEALAIHVNIPSGAFLLKEEGSARQQMVDEIEKRIQEFGKQHGFPVAVVTTKNAVPPILCVGGKMYQDRFVHLFACSEIERAVAFAKMHDGNIEMRDGLPDPEIFRKEFLCGPVLKAPLSEFCKAHHCTERGPKCDRCAYTAMGSSMRRKLEDGA